MMQGNVNNYKRVSCAAVKHFSAVGLCCPRIRTERRKRQYVQVFGNMCKSSLAPLQPQIWVYLLNWLEDALLNWLEDAHQGRQ